MTKIRYSKDVDALLVELSQKPIVYAEESGQLIAHSMREASLSFWKSLTHGTSFSIPCPA